MDYCGRLWTRSNIRSEENQGFLDEFGRTCPVALVTPTGEGVIEK